MTPSSSCGNQWRGLTSPGTLKSFSSLPVETRFRGECPSVRILHQREWKRRVGQVNLLSIHSGLCIPIMRLPCTQSKHIQICTVTLPPPQPPPVPSVSSTEYTQGGNGRFLACIPSWWKNQPWLVRVGGGGCTPTPFHFQLPSLFKAVVYVPAERADTLPLFHLYP